MTWIHTQLVNIVCIIFLSGSVDSALNVQERTQGEGLKGGGSVAKAVMSALMLPHCSLIFIADGNEPSKNIVFEEIRGAPLSWGLGTFEVSNSDWAHENNSLSAFVLLARDARQIRRWLSWNTVVVVVSENIQFLKTFAKSSLDNRLLVWTSRLIVITSITLDKVEQLLTEYWTFSMMNTLIINSGGGGNFSQWNIYSGLPYTPKGQRVVKLGSWTSAGGLSYAKSIGLFPEKFENYHGATINITALPYPPHWMVEEKKNADGTVTETYKGTDALLLQAIASKLNFTYRRYPVNSWLECEERVSERVAFLSTVFFVILPNRMKLHDYTFTYEFMSPAVCARKPLLKPQWESLYYPLSEGVWVSVISAIILMPVVLYLENRVGFACHIHHKISKAFIAEVFVGTMFSQPISRRLPAISSIRMLMVFWLIFAFVIGAAYRGNLTASLTLTKYPPRPELLKEINKAFDIVIMPPHGNEFKQFFAMPTSAPTFQELARRMIVGPPAMEGLQRALTGEAAFMDLRRYVAHQVAKFFTEADGSSQLYIAKENALMGMSAWPIPHDAPFQAQIDALMMAVLQGGLYEKWNDDTLAEARLESQRRQKQQQEKSKDPKNGLSGSRSVTKTLTLVHLQGPFILLGLGLGASLLSLMVEILTANIICNSQKVL